MQHQRQRKKGHETRARSAEQEFAPRSSHSAHRKFLGAFAASQTRHERIHRHDHEEVHGRSNEEKRHQRIDEIPDQKLAPVDFKGNRRKIWLTHNGVHAHFR